MTETHHVSGDAAAGKHATKTINAVMGTMSMPDPLDLDKSREALDAFLDAGFDQIDTAIIYQGGRTEKMLGELGMDKFRVAAKANPWYKDPETHSFTDRTSGLQPAKIKEQLYHSLKTLGLKSVHLFYLHAPDRETPIEESLKAVHELKSEGLFNIWGVSNYTAWETVEIYYICKANGWQPPSVYQGMYNAITRDVERELIPALSRMGMSFYAYNPLAGGILSGKHKFENPPEEGRFSGRTLWGNIYRQRYWRKDIFDALEKLKPICEKHDTDLVSASMRWLRHHSALTGMT